MSDALAIAAVTSMLRNMLFVELNHDVAGTRVTTRPPDRARNGNSGKQVNLFLYNTILSPAWRNMDIPWRVRQGETGQTPLPLNLYYLLTVYYGEQEDDIDTTTDPTRLLGSHRLLGRAMSILHDYAILDPEAIHALLPPGDQLDHPFDSVEKIRITHQPLSLEEISKMWAGFQTQYRMSTAYEVSVVLIESSHPAKTPLPVLTRGPDDSGVGAEASLTPPYPTIENVLLPNNQPSARLGDVLILSGHHLDGDNIIVRFRNPLLEDPIEVAPMAGGTATKISVQIPDSPANWPAGFYTLAAVITKAGEPDRTTNEMPFPLAPRIVNIVPPNPVPRNGSGDVTLTVTCRPEVRPLQNAALLLGDREISAQPHPAQTATLEFHIIEAPVGEHYVRLRIGGIDSLLVDRSVTPPVFDASQKVIII